MKKIMMISVALVIGCIQGCIKESAFLDEVEPKNVLSIDQSMSSPAQVRAVVADLYNKHIDFSTVLNWVTMADFSESFPSDEGSYGIVRATSWGYDAWVLWDYAYVRHLNLFLERLTASTIFSGSEEERKAFLAEVRFLRANHYFEMAKRMGGVPLVLQSLFYELGSDPEYLQFPRAKEHEIYDFVISEAEAILPDLPTLANQPAKGRATKGVAMAMMARAALYAGSIAKYGANTPQVYLPGGEVGIPATMAEGYYRKALAAAASIINGEVGQYSLYLKKTDDLAENFASLFYDYANNPETIWVREFKAPEAQQGFTTRVQPFSQAEDIDEGGRLNPSLNLVQSFERLDNTFAPLAVKDASGNPIYYDTPDAIFNGRDARLKGTVMVPGSSFKGEVLDIFAGLRFANGTSISGDQPGSRRDLPDGTKNVQVVGFDGPIQGLKFIAQTGFYVRKYVDPVTGSGRRLTGSSVPNIRYRFGEVLLNAAEAAFELGELGTAVGYLNELRARAGFTTPLTAAQVTFDRIVHERRVELAFEGHILFDYKRWRIAHRVWNGEPLSESELLSGIGSATKKSTQPYSLLPYKVYSPGNANHGKWEFVINRSNIVTGVNNFRFGNYYSVINDDRLSRNPKLVRQPNQD